MAVPLVVATIPTVERLVGDGFIVEVIFWTGASAELKRLCSKFIELDSHLDELALRPPPPKKKPRT